MLIIIKKSVAMRFEHQSVERKSGFLPTAPHKSKKNKTTLLR